MQPGEVRAAFTAWTAVGAARLADDALAWQAQAVLDRANEMMAGVNSIFRLDDLGVSATEAVPHDAAPPAVRRRLH